MGHLVFDFLFKRRHIVCNNPIYTLEDEDVLSFLSIRSILIDHGTALPFLFSELDNAFVETVNIEKPVSPLLEIFNVDDAAPSSVGHLTSICTTLQDSFMMFRSTTLYFRSPFRKITMVTTDSKSRKNVPRKKMKHRIKKGEQSDKI